MAISPGGRPMDVTPFSASTTDNWVARVGGLDPYIRGVAHALMRKRGMTESQAIQVAWGVIRNWAEGKGHVRPQVRAAAAKTVANMERKRAQAHSLANTTADPVDLARPYRYRHGWIPIGSVGEAHRRLHSEMMSAVGEAMRARKGSREHVTAVAKIRKAQNAIRRLTADLANTPADLIDLAIFDPSKHPRLHGRFAPKGTQTVSAAPDRTLPPDLAAQVRDFQRRTGLPVTGRFDAATVAKVHALTTPNARSTAKSAGKSRRRGKAKHGMTTRGGTFTTSAGVTFRRAPIRLAQEAPVEIRAQQLVDLPSGTTIDLTAPTGDTIDLARKRSMKGYVGFKRLKKALAAKGAADPAALAAYIGRRKYGRAAFAAMSAKGRAKAAVKR